MLLSYKVRETLYLQHVRRVEMRTRLRSLASLLIVLLAVNGGRLASQTVPVDQGTPTATTNPVAKAEQDAPSEAQTASEGKTAAEEATANAEETRSEEEIQADADALAAAIAKKAADAAAAEAKAAAEAEADALAKDAEARAADTSSPRSTLRSFIESMNEVYRSTHGKHYIDRNDARYQAMVARVLDCLDTQEIPSFARDEYAGEVAVCLKEVIDRLEMPRWEEIPDVEMIDGSGGFEKLSRWRIPGTRITLARVEEGPQKHEYLFSPGTVARAHDYFRSIESREYRTTGPETSPGLHRWYISAPGRPFVAEIVNQLPESLRYGRSMGMANWKWPGVLIALFLAIGLMALLYKCQVYIATRTENRRIFLYCLSAVFPLFAMFVPFLFEHVARQYLTVRGTPLYIISFFSITTSVFAAIVLVFVISNRVAEAIISSPRVNRQGLNAQLIRIASKLMSVVMTVAVFLIGGQYLGIPVATLLASAGVGGIALALGAQDTLKTLFGTVMLMADKPFRVGERIVFKGYDGVVEDIGLRSTRIRLLTSHLVTIPNDELARSDIENVGRRDYIRRVFDIHIPLDTPCEKVEAAVEIVRNELKDHEGLRETHPPRVYFFEFMPGAFTIRVMYWYHPADYWGYLAFGEAFNFAIFRAFESRGISFNLPQRLTAAAHDGQPAPLEIKTTE